MIPGRFAYRRPIRQVCNGNAMQPAGISIDAQNSGSGFFATTPEQLQRMWQFEAC
jgi:hypothetical protein